MQVDSEDVESTNQLIYISDEQDVITECEPDRACEQNVVNAVKTAVHVWGIARDDKVIHGVKRVRMHDGSVIYLKFKPMPVIHKSGCYFHATMYMVQSTAAPAAKPLGPVPGPPVRPLAVRVKVRELTRESVTLIPQGCHPPRMR